MYGGSHYIMSAAADITPQGKAILEATRRFGGKDSHSLPFPPCKKYYNPYCKETSERLFACRLHNDMRKKRLKKENWKWRPGEKNLDMFWTEETPMTKKKKIKQSTKHLKK